MPALRGTSASVASSGPPSPTMSAHTTATNVGLPSARLPSQLINRADLRNSLSAYEAILTASKAYTQALLALGSASSELASALEACSRLKGAHQVGSGLLAASGVHHMSSNSWSILADTFWKDTSIPLMEHHDLYVQACAERTLAHEKAIVQKSRALNEAEKRNQKESRSKVGRDLGSFRRALLELQRHVDDLDEEKARYYADVLEGEEECWSFVQDKMIASMRNQLDMFERISSKGLSDAVLEPLLSNIPDPFSAYGPPRNDDQIFSILNHGTLLSMAPSPDHSHESNYVGGKGEQNGETAGASSSAAADRPVGNSVTANLIMSPGTPSRGLSRVASGTASPRLNSEPTMAADGKGANGLGISLTAAVALARASDPSAAPNGSASSTTVPATSTKASSNNHVITAAVDQNAELFGTDGEDDGGDEASIFSGTEDDLENASNIHNGIEGQNGKPLPLGMAARIMQEKKRRRENAVRANAKTRLKHALSTIDESKGGGASVTINASPAAADGQPSTTDDDDGYEQDEGNPENNGNAKVLNGHNNEDATSALKERDLNQDNTDVASKEASHGKAASQSEAEGQPQQQHDVDSVWT